MTTPPLTLPATLSEDAFQTLIIDTARWHQWRVTHFRSVRTPRGWATPLQGDAGFPDLVLARTGQVIVAELKTNTGALSAAQDRWLASLGEHGRVWRPRDWPTILLELQDGVQQ